LALQTLFQALGWSLGANTSLLPKFHPNLKIPRGNPIKFYPNSKPRSLSEFSFEIYSESGEVPMEKVVPFFKSFKTLFYFKKFKLVKVLF
jgi:hypothetical protein